MMQDNNTPTQGDPVTQINNSMDTPMQMPAESNVMPKPANVSAAKKSNTSMMIIVFLFILVLLLGGIVGYLLLSSDEPEEINNDEPEIETTVEPTVEEVVDQVEVTVEPSSSDEPVNDVEEISYDQSYQVQAVSYEPDPSNYVGFKVCNQELASCSIYAIDNDVLSKVVLGSMYNLSFNECTDDGVAAGTSYCIIEGDFELLAL